MTYGRPVAAHVYIRVMCLPDINNMFTFALNGTCSGCFPISVKNIFYKSLIILEIS